MKRLIGLAVFIWSTFAASEPFNVSCVFNTDDDLQQLPLDSSKPLDIEGDWVTKAELKALKADRLHPGLPVGRDVFVLKDAGESLLKLCFETYRRSHDQKSLYYARLHNILVYRPGNKRCQGHVITTQASDGALIPLERDSAGRLREQLRKYNFAPIFEGLIYRSSKLGKEGMSDVFKVFAEERLPKPRSIASIHVAGYGGDTGAYNLEEMEQARELGMTYLHTYARDPKLTVYVDGKDPSTVPEQDAKRGNIYRGPTIDRYIPDVRVRQRLAIEQSLAEGRRVVGDTADFLRSLENIIDAPWPLIIHCRGGHHKTGMFAIIFEYLAYNVAMSLEDAKQVKILARKKRRSAWLESVGGPIRMLIDRSYYSYVELRPAELHYLDHNRGSYRQKNIDFVRQLVEGKVLTTPALQEHWERIHKKFKAKLAQHAPYLKGL